MPSAAKLERLSAEMDCSRQNPVVEMPVDETQKGWQYPTIPVQVRLRESR
jgi:hypothetical protein